MARFIVMTARNDPSGETVRFVRDGFRPLAFAMPIVWLLWNGLWLNGAVMFALDGAAAWAASAAGHAAGPALILLINAALGILTALEGPAWLAADLQRRELVASAVIHARSGREAEEQFACVRPAIAPALAPRCGFHPVSAASLIPLTGA